VTERAGHAVELAREAARSRADAVLVCGGDGTVNETLEGLAGSRTALAQMPLGTANVLGHELGLKAAPRWVTELVLHGRPRRLDLGRCGRHFFICMASAGFDAYVTQQMAELRKGSINYLSYVRPTLKAFWDYPFEPLRVEVDGKPVEPCVYNVVVGNTRSYGAPFTMTPQARPDDGRLDVCAFAGRGRAWLALYMAATTVPVHHRLASVRYLTGLRIDVDAASPVAVQLDGDYKTQTPVRFEVVPNAITVLSSW
jgi:YegS/Rv2252/BmrU family lipid kinase